MTKAEDIAAKVDIKAHAKRLAKIIVPKHVALLELAWASERERLPVLGAFDLKNPATQRVIKTLGKSIVGISQTTRADILATLEAALAGEGAIPGMAEIAKRLRAAGVIVSKSRSVTIARSESAIAFNTGAIIAYAEAGVTHVEVLDGDSDEECATANGQTWTLEEAQENPIAHPNCTRAFAPIVK